MPPELSLWFQLGLSVVSAIFGYFIHELRRQNDKQRTDVESLTVRLHQIEVLVAGEYVKKDALRHDLDALFATLRRIEDKLERKVDK